jgi:hypothetical protein
MWALLRSLLVGSIASGYTLASAAQATIRVPADQPTIQAAINAAQNGDTVLVAPGTYNENIDFKGKAIAVTSGAKSFADASSTIISGIGNNGPVVVFKTNESAASVFNGFTVEHGDSTAIYLNGTSATITNNVITNNNACVIVVSGPTASPVISGNEISHTTVDSNIFDCGVQPPKYLGPPARGTAVSLLEAGSVHISGNTIEDNGSLDPTTGTFNGGGIYADTSTDVFIENNTIRNNLGSAVVLVNNAQMFVVQNLIYGNSSRGAAVRVDTLINNLPPTVTPTFALWVVNNTVYGNTENDTGSVPGNFRTGSQGSFYGAFVQNTIANNLFISPDGTPAVNCLPRDALGSSYPIIFINNDSFNSGQLQPNTCIVSASTASNLAVDPQFLNPGAGDFHTQRTSPVVAAGDINAPNLPPGDLDNKARSVCGTVDMGVYEIHPQPATAISSSNNPSVGGTPITLTAVPGNCNTPTGTVTFLDGTNVLGTKPLDAGASASISTDKLTVGMHTITVTYPGDFNFDASTSSPFSQVVTGYPTSTSLIVTPNPAGAFQPITLSSTVSSASGIPTGTVTFTSGGKTLATTLLGANGSASTTISTLGAGSYSIVATYSADVNFAASSSAPTIETVTGADSVTSVTASPNPATLVQAVRFLVSVRAAQGTAVPTGTVTFTEGGSALGSATLDASGKGSFSLSTLALGPHTITASFSSTGNFNPSSASVNELVTVIATNLVLSVSPNPAAVGQPVTIQASASTSSPIPYGTVTFFDGSAVLGTGSVNAAGQASLTTRTRSRSACSDR